MLRTTITSNAHNIDSLSVTEDLNLSELEKSNTR